MKTFKNFFTSAIKLIRHTIMTSRLKRINEWTGFSVHGVLFKFQLLIVVLVDMFFFLMTLQGAINIELVHVAISPSSEVIGDYVAVCSFVNGDSLSHS